MPVIKGDRIGESRKINRRSVQAQDFYALLVASVPDDFGRFRFSPAHVALRLYPRREPTPAILKRTKKLLDELAADVEGDGGLLRTWEADSVTWAELTDYQASGNRWHRTPEPPWSAHVQNDANTTRHEHSGACLSTAISQARGCGDHATADALSLRLKELRVPKEHRGHTEATPGPHRGATGAAPGGDSPSPPSPPSPSQRKNGQQQRASDVRATAPPRLRDERPPFIAPDETRKRAECDAALAEIVAHEQPPPDPVEVLRSASRFTAHDGRERYAVRTDTLTGEYLERTRLALLDRAAACRPARAVEPVRVDPRAVALWASVQQRLREDIPERQWALWIEPVMALSATDRLRLLVPSAAEYREGYVAAIVAACAAEGHPVASVDWVVDREAWDGLLLCKEGA